MLRFIKKNENEIKKILACAHSDQGPVRKKNQDRVFCAAAGKKKNYFSCACVCDGIGSFEHSEIAAETVTNGIAQWYSYVFRNIESFSETAVVENLEKNIIQLNKAVYDYRKNKKEDIGCTMSLLMIINNSYYIFHVGDSQIYSVREDMYKLTLDEVTIKMKDGKIKSYLSNYIGKNEEIWLNKGKGTVGKGDTFVLGSDGFCQKTEYADYIENLKMMKTEHKMHRLCKQLVEKVVQRGATDNVSCIVVHAAD